MWEHPQHAGPGRDRPMEPWSAETGAERGASRSGLPEPVQWSGALAPVGARVGRTGVHRRNVPCFRGLEVAQAPWAMAVRPAGAPGPRPASPGSSCTRGRPAMVPGPRASWRTRRRWRPAPWPPVPPGSARRPGRGRPPRRQSGGPWWGAASHGSFCGPRRRTAWRGRAGACQRPGRPLWPGARRASPRWPTPWRRGAGPARGGAHTTTSDSVSRAWGRCVPGRSCWHSPRGGRARGSPSQPGSAWRPAMAPGGRAWRHVCIRRSQPCINGGSLQGKAQKSL